MSAEPVEAGTVEPEPISEQGGPGLTWAGDGSLTAGRRPPERSPLDVEFEIYPPIIEEGDKGYELATFNRRWVGFLIDQIVILGLAFAISLITGFVEPNDAQETAAWAATVTLVRLGYGLIFNPRGWSPGKLIVGLRIVNEEGDPPGLRYGIVRTAGAVISESLLYVGYIWAFFDGKTQTWHDKFAKTYVVRVEENQLPSSDGWRRR